MGAQIKPQSYGKDGERLVPLISIGCSTSRSMVKHLAPLGKALPGQMVLGWPTTLWWRIVTHTAGWSRFQLRSLAKVALAELATVCCNNQGLRCTQSQAPVIRQVWIAYAKCRLPACRTPHESSISIPAVPWSRTPATSTPGRTASSWCSAWAAPSALSWSTASS